MLYIVGRSNFCSERVRSTAKATSAEAVFFVARSMDELVLLQDST